MLAEGFTTPSRAGLRIAAASAGLLLLTACSISEAVHVRKGISPQYADDNVRFRTTYYFRSVDFCEPAEEADEANYTFGGRLPPSDEQVFIRKSRISRVLKDTLYRFTMTGKASPLSKVRFESGTLKNWQIDPFGASVAFDEDNNRFYWKSQASTQSDARISEIVEDVRRLSALGREMRDNENEPAAVAIDNLITTRLAALQTLHPGEAPLTLVQAVAARLRGTSSDAVKGVEELAGKLEVTETPPASPKAEETSPTAQQAAILASLTSQLTSVGKEIAWLEIVENKAKDKLAAAAKALEDEKAKQPNTTTPPAETPPPAPAATTNTGGQQPAEPPAPAAAPTTVVTSQPLDGAGNETLSKLEEARKNAEDNLRKVKDALDRARSAEAGLKLYKAQLENGQLAQATPQETGDCAPGARFGRGFQLIGPEGVQTFNQDDRLIMAMSSSATPILSALSELSGRMLRQEAGRSDRLLPLVQEQVRISRAENSLTLVESKPTGELKAAIEEVIRQLKAGDGQ
jgi:hypothetical protein